MKDKPVSDDLPLKKWGKLEISKQFCVISQNTYSSVWCQGLLISQQWNVRAFLWPDSMMSQTVLVSRVMVSGKTELLTILTLCCQNALIAPLSMASAWQCAVVLLWTDEPYWKQVGFFRLESHNQTWFFEGRRKRVKKSFFFPKIMYVPSSNVI